MIYEYVERYCTENSVIIEIGSHFGTDTEKMYELTKAHIHCFEPDPRNFKILQERGIDKIAKLNELAISDSIGETTFHLSGGKVYTGNPLLDDHDWSASSSLKKPKKHLEKHPWCNFNNEVTVNMITLDEYCKINDITEIDFIWCDCQGAEDKVFKGAQEILKKTKYIYTEFSDEELYEGQPNLESIIELLPNKWTILFFEGENVLLKNDEF